MEYHLFEINELPDNYLSPTLQCDLGIHLYLSLARRVCYYQERIKTVKIHIMHPCNVNYSELWIYNYFQMKTVNVLLVHML